MTSATAKQEPRERFLAEDRKNQIVQTVLVLVNERGVDAVSTQLIADTIGRSQGIVFRHFPTKEALWNSVFEWLQEQLEDVWLQSRKLHDSGSPLQTLGRMFRGHIKLIATYPGLAKLVMSDHLRHQYPSLNGSFGELHRRYEQQVVALLKEGVRGGTVSSAINIVDAATLFFCMIQGLGFQFAIARLRPGHLNTDAARLFLFWRDALAADEAAPRQVSRKQKASRPGRKF